MKNIEKMTTLAIVLLVLSIPMVYAATSSHASIKVGVTGEGDAIAHSIAKASDGGSADAASEATASDGGSASANARADASGPGSTATAIVKATNENRDCQAEATGGDTDTCVTGIGNVAVIGGPTDTATGIGNVAVTEDSVETSDSSSGDMSIASSEDDSGGPVIKPGDAVTMSGFDNVLVLG